VPRRISTFKGIIIPLVVFFSRHRAWARDLPALVTSIMTNATPYDHTTPPPSPQTNSQSQTPQISCAVFRPPVTVNPRQTTPAAAYIPLREGRTVARDGFYALRKSASFPSRTTSFSIPENSNSKANPYKNGGVPVAPLAVRPQTAHDKAPERKPEPNLLDDLQDDIPQKPTMPKVPKLNDMATVEPASSTKTKVKKNKVNWTSKLRQQRRPSEIFNMNFSFNSPSRRRPSDHTPQVSPRTSISSDSSSPTPTPEEPFKRQRVDSSSNPNPNSSPSFTHNSSGYNLGPAPSGPANIWFAEDILRLTPISTRAPPHPGFPVSFTSLFSREAFARTRKSAEQEDDECYHTYLDEQRLRDNSSPHQTRIFHMDMDDSLHHHSSTHDPIRAIDSAKEARISGLVTNPKHANTHTRKSTASSSASGSTRTRRTSSSLSNPDPSTDKFLEHVRKSQEARRCNSAEKKREEVWLGDDPL
jgi:hypothetical protein